MARKTTRKSSTSRKKTSARGAAKGGRTTGSAGSSGGRAAAKSSPRGSSKAGPKAGRSRPVARPASSGRGKGAAPRASKAPSRGRRAASKPRRSQESLFAEGVERAMQGYLFDAISLFEDAIDADPRGSLADDALFNMGTVYLRMRLVKDAEQAFTRLLEEYPDSAIDSVFNAKEQGRTAAKALLGRMQARLAQGDVAGATADREALRAYGDSWVLDPSGARKSFHDLATAVMQ